MKETDSLSSFSLYLLVDPATKNAITLYSMVEHVHLLRGIFSLVSMSFQYRSTLKLPVKCTCGVVVLFSVTFPDFS